VGFALEVEEDSAQARTLALDKLRRKDLDLICLNNPRRPGSAFGSTTNEVTILARDGTCAELPLLDKLDAAREILLQAARLLPARP
jgi:phosphopantothenoylcysteine decarboxylase/phosphopantothenate--cysteine ligase